MNLKTVKIPTVKPFVGQHVTQFHYTDRDAWEVIEIISERRIKIRQLHAELTRAPKDFHQGGFFGHFADNHDQEYKLSSKLDNPVKTLSWRGKAKRWSEVGQNTKYSLFGLHQKGEKATQFYDYNF